MKFFEWFEQYHNIYCVDEISFDCYKEYEYINQKHFTHIRNFELTDIKPIDIQICLKTTNAYSCDRKRKTYFLIKRVLREAIVNGLISSNPVDAIKPPKKIKKDIRCFNITHLEMLFDNDCKESRMFQLALWTGLRRGELLALHWDNIDIANAVLYICQTLVRTPEGDIIKYTTKGRCDRIIPLHQKAISLLKRIHSLDSDKGFLFCKAGSDIPMKLRTYNSLYSKYYKKQQEKHKDLPYYTPHNLRHSYATYIVRSPKLDWTVRSAQRSIMQTNNPMSIVLRFIFCLFLQGKQAQAKINQSENILNHRRLCSSFPKQYKTLRTENPERRYRSFGNISYGKLKQAQGENFSVRVSLSRMLMLVNQPLFYTAQIDTKTGTATITIKDYNKAFAAKLMGIENLDDVLEKQNEEISNRRMYTDLKKSAADSGVKLQYEVIDESQLTVLKSNYVDFAYFLKEGGKINIAYLPEKREHIARLIHEQKPKETEKQRNNRIYAQMKTAAAKAGEKLRYITDIRPEQLELLRKTNITFAYHESKKREGCFNVSCLSEDYDKVREAAGIISGARRKID